MKRPLSYKSNIEKADRTREAVHFPEVILIDNCSACNLRCSMCDHRNIKKYRKIKIMDSGLYRKIINEIAIENPRARVWMIFFGEPCLCRDMPERIHYAKEKGLTDVVLNSNGTLLDREKASAYIASGLDALYVGIDAASEETYRKIRVGGRFRDTVENVLTYRDLLAAQGRDGQQLFVQFVVSEINEKELENFKAFWLREGVHVKIRPKVSWGGLVEANNLRSNEQVRRKPCYWLMRTLNICSDGRVALCSVDVHCREECGNVTGETLKALWKGRLKVLRAHHANGQYEQLPPLCRNCPDWQSGYAEFEYASPEDRI